MEPDPEPIQSQSETYPKSFESLSRTDPELIQNRTDPKPIQNRSETDPEPIWSRLKSRTVQNAPQVATRATEWSRECSSWQLSWRSWLASWLQVAPSWAPRSLQGRSWNCFSNVLLQVSARIAQDILKVAPQALPRLSKL